MASRTAYKIARVLRIALVAPCLFAGCTCSSKTGKNQTPTATIRLPTAPRAVTRPTDTPPPATATPASPTPAATPTPAVDCNRIVAAVLAGQDARTLNAPRSGSLNDLYECVAVMQDSDAPCQWAHAPAECRAGRKFWHEARTATGNWPTLVAAAIAAECGPPNASVEACNAFTAAVSGQDPSKCPPELANLCRGLALSDPTQCGADAACEQEVKVLQLLQAGGVAMVAEKGTGQVRDSASAALGRKTACSETARAYLEECVRTSAAAPAPASSTAAVSAAPSPGTPPKQTSTTTSTTPSATPPT